jgi:bleomycin hydrolase
MTTSRKPTFRSPTRGLHTCLVPCLLLILAGTALGQDPVYREQNKYPILDEIEAARDDVKAIRDSIRQDVDDRYADEKKDSDAAAKDLRVDWTKIKSPASPDDFDALWHLPPTPQYYTGTCWAFCSTSYMESEARRISGVEVKLSEMWIVYWEYVEKSRSYLRTFGHTPVDQGGQDHGTVEIMRQYGAVPRDSYVGVLTPDGRHDHTPLITELKSYLKWVLKSGSWDEEQNLAYVRSILDKHMGPPPVDAQFEGKIYSPLAFVEKVLQLDMDDYVACVSRMNEPFYSRVLLDVHDNWRRKDNYLNLPLHDFYEVIKESVKAGYTLSIGGDNSEAGMDGKFDTAIIPDWDIPVKYINQGSREFRIANRSTGDDHGVHIVGFKRIGNRDWYLIKDSNRSSRLGDHKGYYFWSADYIQLKMLSFTVHKDRLKGMLD